MSEMTPDCPHGEYTLVTGAQTSALALQITVFGVKCTKCGKQWDMGDMMTAPARIEALEREVEVDDKLLTEQDRLLDAIPACEAHGNQCVPHAIEWVRAAKDLADLRKVIDRLQAILAEYAETIDALAREREEKP
jgi:hypothetical protein